jgi:3-hydroxyisobutyrate dehydrogenase-like beta-hydroxyacid dehydrogenase
MSGESERVSVDLYAALFAEGDRARTLAQVIHANNYDQSPHAPLAVWYAALQRIQTQARDAGINCDFPDFAAGLFRRALTDGHGEEDVAALIKVLRDKH